MGAVQIPGAHEGLKGGKGPMRVSGRIYMCVCVRVGGGPRRSLPGPSFPLQGPISLSRSLVKATSVVKASMEIVMSTQA